MGNSVTRTLQCPAPETSSHCFFVLSGIASNSARPDDVATILVRQHAHQMQEDGAHLIGIEKARQPADFLDRQVGRFQKMPGTSATAEVHFGEQAVPPGCHKPPCDNRFVCSRPLYCECKARKIPIQEAHFKAQNAVGKMHLECSYECVTCK